MPTRPDMLRASWRSWIATDFVRVGPWWLQLVWTALFCAVLAVGLTVVGFLAFARGPGAWRNLDGWAHWYLINLHMSLVIGFLTHGLLELGGWLIGHRRVRAFGPWQRRAFFGGLPVLGVLLGWPLGYLLLGREVTQWFEGDRLNVLFGMLLFSLLLTLVVAQVLGAKGRELQAQKQATLSHLQLLQAQIEPHFLFNTLANVLSLIDSDPARARRMLEAFTDYLRSSLGELRRSDVALHEELGLATAYLQVQQLRMDDRLRFVIDVDAQARAARLPPLLVQPLVENAVHHGLEPKLEGGTVRLHAWREGERLVIEVDDDGLGLSPSGAARPGVRSGGVALANIRERLASRFGDDAQLTLQPLSPGTRCRLELPYETHKTQEPHPTVAAPTPPTPALPRTQAAKP